MRNRQSDSHDSLTERSASILPTLDKSGLQLHVRLPSTAQAWQLPPTGAVVIGRSTSADIRIHCSCVSRRHALLDRRGEQFFITDLDSANGTFIGGTRLAAHAPVLLSLLDAITVGSAQLNFIIQHTCVAKSRETESREEVAGCDSLDAVVQRVANSDISVLVLGETGVGKEVLAHQIHKLSPRAKEPMVCIDCGALPESLLEAEIFGFERGAFTGALKAKAGLFESAQGGTLFLDEVGELTLSAQIKLLRVLEERRVRRIGGLQARPIGARLVCATNRDLEKEIRAGRFRQDLFFRINGVSLTLPPLRERRDEFDGFVDQFLRRGCIHAGRVEMSILPEAREALHAYSWPGNLRELRNVVERAIILCEGGAIGLRHLSPAVRGVGVAISAPTESAEPTMPSEPPARIDERARIQAALEHCAGNQTRAANWLGVSRGAFVKRLDRFGLPRPQKLRRK